MANPPTGSNLHKAQMVQGLGKSTLISPSLSIPMPSGAATPPPSNTSNQGQGQSTPGSAGQGAPGFQNNG
jgi:hypothetical protein